VCRNEAVCDDIFVMGTGDSDLAELTSPPIRAARRELAAIGETHAEIVVAWLAGPAAPLSQIVFSRELMLRQTCASPRFPEQRCRWAGSRLSGTGTTSQSLRCCTGFQTTQLRGLPKNLLAMTQRNDAKAAPDHCEGRSDGAINVYSVG